MKSERKELQKEASGLIEVVVRCKEPITREDIISTIFDFIRVARDRIERHAPFEEIAGPLKQAEIWLGELQGQLTD